LGAGLLASQSAPAQTLFSDDFQADSSANWGIYAINALGQTTDYTAQFSFDYSTQAYRYNGVTNHVPSAPNSTGGTTKGLKLTVNKSGVASVAAVSLYPKNQSFSGNFSLKFDLWNDYSGDIPFGDGGSTEFSAFGIGHYGTNVNWPNTPQNGDGQWFLVSADGGSGRDFRAYIGNSSPAPNTELDVNTGGFIDRDGDGAGEQNDPDTGFSPLQLMFPAPPGQTEGAIGKQWSQVEVRQQNGILTWLVNGYIIAQRPSDLGGNNSFPAGNIMIGHQDPFNSELPDEPYENYSIFDNIRVIDLGTSDPPPIVDITAVDNDASEPGSNTGLFTLSRTGSTANNLTVSLRISGTASNGVDYVTIPSTITFKAGDAFTNITVTPINDSIGEPVETVILSIAGNPNSYDVRSNYAIVNITDDNDVPIATISALRQSAYENHRAGLFQVSFSNPNSSDTTVNFTRSGTAANGIDYTNIGTSVLIPAGSTTAVIPIDPINNAIRDGDRTVILALASGSGYSIGTASNATVKVLDDDFAQGGVLFADDFETNSSSLWRINTVTNDDVADFGFDYSTIGIPSAPHSAGGTTFGLKLRANDTNATASAISVSPVNGNFTGDYRLRFDLWINYNGPLDVGGDGSTEFTSAGIGTKGVTPVWSLGGAANDDGVWVSMDGDSGNGRDVRLWRNNTEVTAGSNPGVYPAGSQNTANTAYYYFLGLDPAPPGQIALYPFDQTTNTVSGNVGFAWHDVMLTKIGSNVTWVIDGVKIASVNATGTVMSSNVFVGFYDPSSNISPIPDLSFALIDNLKVVTMQAPLITKIQNAGGSVTVDFSASTVDSPSGFTLQSASSVTGPFVDVSSSNSQLSPGQFRAVRASSGSAQFYRIRR
jgi:hypothetical protein